MTLGKTCVNMWGCGLSQSLKQFQHLYFPQPSPVGNPRGQSLLPSAVLSHTDSLVTQTLYCEVAMCLLTPNFHTHYTDLMK